MNEVIIKNVADNIAIIQINRPERKNALNSNIRALLADNFTKLIANPEIKVIIITGDENNFVAGADINEMQDIDSTEILLRQNERYWQVIAQCPKPIIAAVNGFALGGGCELAMHADIIIAGNSAKFGQPEIKIGLMPGAGGTQRLTRVAGKFKTMLYLLTGQLISAAEAEKIGLVSEVVADDLVLNHAITIANTIAKMPPIAVKQIKEVVLAGQDISLDSALMLERKAFQLLFNTKDKQEGIEAFLEKRSANYTGK